MSQLKTFRQTQWLANWTDTTTPTILTISCMQAVNILKNVWGVCHNHVYLAASMRAHIFLCIFSDVNVT